MVYSGKGKIRVKGEFLDIMTEITQLAHYAAHVMSDQFNIPIEEALDFLMNAMFATANKMNDCSGIGFTLNKENSDETG